MRRVGLSVLVAIGLALAACADSGGERVGYSSKNCEYAGNSGWVATATMIKRAIDWLTTVEQATGRKPIIYSYPAWFA